MRGRWVWCSCLLSIGCAEGLASVTEDDPGARAGAAGQSSSTGGVGGGGSSGSSSAGSAGAGAVGAGAGAAGAGAGGAGAAGGASAGAGGAGAAGGASAGAGGGAAGGTAGGAGTTSGGAAGTAGTAAGGAGAGGGSAGTAGSVAGGGGAGAGGAGASAAGAGGAGAGGAGGGGAGAGGAGAGGAGAGGAGAGGAGAGGAGAGGAGAGGAGGAGAGGAGAGGSGDPCGPTISFDFEGGTQGFTHAPTSGIASDDPWAHGSPTGLTCHGGTKCWATTLAGGYTDCQTADLRTPTIDLSACASSPKSVTLKFWHRYVFEPKSSGKWWDGGLVQLSADDGQTWSDVSPTPPYEGPIEGSYAGCNPKPEIDGHLGWSGTIPGNVWTEVSVDLPAAFRVSKLRVRWLFGSDAATTKRGWGIDDVSIVAQ